MLTLGLAYENDILKRKEFSHWWDRMVLKTFTEEESYSVVRITDCTPYDWKKML